MSQPAPNAAPHTLLLHDGELGDVCSLLVELGTPFVERRGALAAEDAPETFALVLATPQRLLALQLPQEKLLPKRIAICDSDSRGLRSSLQRAGVQLMVRRPVHRAALRALLLHALYRGPEKRRSVRVAIGAPVRFRAGWRQHHAILTDLSVGGCRLLSSQAAEPGRQIKLQIPTQVSGNKAFSLRARVLRRWHDDDGQALTAKFENLRPRELDLLRRVVKTHAAGPARYAHTEGGAPEPEPAPPARGGDRSEARERPPAPVHAAPSAPPPSPAPPPAPAATATDDRRASPRRTMDRRVIALGEEASRVLMGRDISLGGMRVNPNPLLVVGDDVRLAIHTGELDQPLVLKARVHRDDGERGVVLRFHALAPDATRTLNRLLDMLPVIETNADGGPGMIVSEIIAEAR